MQCTMCLYIQCTLHLFPGLPVRDAHSGDTLASYDYPDFTVNREPAGNSGMTKMKLFYSDAEVGNNN